MDKSEDADGSVTATIAPVYRYEGSFKNFKLQYTLHENIGSGQHGHTGIFCDYESSDWNYSQFISWFSEHLPSFALTPQEFSDLNDRNMIEKLERAAAMLYSRKHKVDRRGEFGELILHGLIRDIYQTTPLISKIYYKSAPGETVKGADCVHVIEKDGEVDSLWLGEAKFYSDGSEGLREAVASVQAMLTRLENKEEFITIKHHLKDSQSAIARKAEELLSDAVSLDKIKAKLCIPILVTYESSVTQKHSADSDLFREQLNAEIEPLIRSFLEKTRGIKEVDVHIFFMPLKDKAKLIEILDTFVDKKRSIQI